MEEAPVEPVADVRGTPVYDAEGEKVGSVKERVEVEADAGVDVADAADTLHSDPASSPRSDLDRDV